MKKLMIMVIGTIAILSPGFSNSAKHVKKGRKIQAMAVSKHGKYSRASITLSDQTVWQWNGSHKQAANLERWKKKHEVEVSTSSTIDELIIRINNKAKDESYIVVPAQRNFVKNIFPCIEDFTWQKDWFGLFGSNLFIKLTDGSVWKVEHPVLCKDWLLDEHVFVNKDREMIHFPSKTRVAVTLQEK